MHSAFVVFWKSSRIRYVDRPSRIENDMTPASFLIWLFLLMPRQKGGSWCPGNISGTQTLLPKILVGVLHFPMDIHSHNITQRPYPWWILLLLIGKEGGVSGMLFVVPALQNPQRVVSLVPIVTPTQRSRAVYLEHLSHPGIRSILQHLWMTISTSAGILGHASARVIFFLIGAPCQYFTLSSHLQRQADLRTSGFQAIITMDRIFVIPMGTIPPTWKLKKLMIWKFPGKIRATTYFGEGRLPVVGIPLRGSPPVINVIGKSPVRKYSPEN